MIVATVPLLSQSVYVCFLEHSDTTVDQHTFGIVLELGAELNRAGISTLTTWSGKRNFIATHGDNRGTQSGIWRG
jgi:hypothetical protein